MPIADFSGATQNLIGAYRDRAALNAGQKSQALGAVDDAANSVGEALARKQVEEALQKEGLDPALARDPHAAVTAIIQKKQSEQQAQQQSARDTTLHGFQQQDAETEAMRRQAELDKARGFQIGRTEDERAYAEKQRSKDEAAVSEAFQPVTEPMPAKPMTVGGFPIGTQPQNLVEATQRDPTPEEIQMSLGRKGRLVDPDKLRATTPKGPDPYGGRTREQYMRDKKEEADATRAPSQPKSPPLTPYDRRKQELKAEKEEGVGPFAKKAQALPPDQLRVLKTKMTAPELGHLNSLEKVLGGSLAGAAEQKAYDDYVAKMVEAHPDGAVSEAGGGAAPGAGGTPDPTEVQRLVPAHLMDKFSKMTPAQQAAALDQLRGAK